MAVRNYYTTVVQAFSPASLPNIRHWYRSTVGVTFDPLGTRATRVNDQIGTIDWLDAVAGFTRVVSDPAVPNGTQTLASPSTGPVSVDRALGDAAAGWVTTLPFTVIHIGKLAFTSGTPSELIRPVVGAVGSGVTLARRSNVPLNGTNANEYRAATSGNLLLNGAGANNINFNSTTGANLLAGETTPFQIIGLSSATGANGLQFSRNGTLVVQSTPVTPRVYTGAQLGFGLNTPAITWLDIIVMNATMSAGDYTNLKNWLNAQYGFSF